jgi:formylglycine-generating enzyme required for sulfatase activity
MVMEGGRMRLCSLALLVALAIGVASPSRAIYGVRISDLGNTPVPPNPMRIWGQVTSESPLKVNDGRAEVVVTGITATLGELLVVDGWWDGSVFAVLPDGPYPGQMIYIPAGSFLMGNNGSEPYSYSDELPQHSVYLSGYWIGKYEVTRGEYAQFMAAGGYSNPAYWSTDGWYYKNYYGWTEPRYWVAVQDWGTSAFTQTDSHPVVGVSYYECEAFCNWAGGHLPTEAQWERAARWTGSYPNVYPWGNTWNQEYCNNYYDSNPAGGGCMKYQTAPVGSYSSYGSPSGCQDMAGNVWEWCRDWYSSTYYSVSPGSDPQGPTSGSSRVLRGGGWLSYVDGGYRCACRYVDGPSSYDSSYYGFRLAR